MYSIDYIRSLSFELLSVKDRVRHFIGDRHWGEDGRFKEVILMEKLEEMLPSSVSVCTGFIVNNDDENKISKQIDIIIYNNSYPLPFSLNDFAIIDYRSVVGVIEVKSKQSAMSLAKTIKKSSEISELMNKREYFNGIFIYEDGTSIDNKLFKTSRPDLNKITDLQDKHTKRSNSLKRQPNKLAHSLVKGLEEATGRVNHICLGPHIFVKYWDNNNHTSGYYDFYDIQDLSVGYFIANLIDVILTSTGVPLNTLEREKRLYPLPEGKISYEIERYRVNTP